MPVATDETGLDALETVCDNLNSPSFKAKVGAKEADIAFLSDFLNGVIPQCMVDAHDSLEGAALEPVSCDGIELVQDLSEDLAEQSAQDPAARELKRIISDPHFMAMVEAHDDIAAKNYEDSPDSIPIMPAPPVSQHFPTGPPTDAIRMVGIRKTPEEPLGITVKEEGENLVIARIMTGSVIERQGLLHVGDIIKEINGQEVTDPDQLQELMRKASGSITLKILPSYYDQASAAQIYLKAHFNYEPKKDNLIPCRDAGLPFVEGNILQVVNMEDANWWQARRVDENGPSGLIPSQTLEEKRKAFVRPEFDYTHKSLLCGLVTKKKRKVMYKSKSNSEFDRGDVMIYEEVARMPPFQRKTLCLIGAQGVGRRSLKHRLVKADPSRFGSVIPHTSREIRPGEVDGDHYWFVTPEHMERDIGGNKFIEYGEYESSYYGTKFDAVRRVVRAGKMCILDINPQALKAVKTSEFMPYVVFIAAPPVEIMRNIHEYERQRNRTDKIKTERDFRNTLEESSKIERHYRNFFDLVIVNDNMDATYNKLRKAIETLSTEPQWVPVSWVY